MMTNETATVGIQEILAQFDDEDLHSLAGTVTQGLLRNKIGSRNEAINAIINYSPDVVSILKRKILTREILFSYLHNKHIPVTTPITKNELIEKILDVWNISRSRSSYQPQLGYDNYQAIQNTNLSQISSEHPRTPSYCTQESKTVSVNYMQEHNTVAIHQDQAESSNITQLAEQFSQWFYQMLNKNECIEPEHFFPDARLKVNLYNNGQCDTKSVENNPLEITQTLFETRWQHNLIFNPNISKEGVQGKMDPHGLVLVLVCGTLHVNDICTGVFEQVFSLARDPLCDNNWKIKNTEMHLRSKNNVIKAPSLCDSESMLALPSGY